MSDPRVIMLEFNELAPSLMARFIGQGLLPNFKRLHDESHVHLTEAAERAPDLDPWIQWVTVHSGADYAEHGISRLNEGHTFERKRIWDLISDSGRRVWVCGSMSVRYETPINGWVLPDPWTTKVAPYPASLEPFFSFVQKNVLEHTNERLPLSRADYASFGRFMLANGLSASTVASILRQLRAERKEKCRWKRATLLDRIQFDVFSSHYRRAKPHFSTFFLNSTAHYQHMYWRAMEPEVFKVQPSAEERQQYGGAILYGYQQMDELVGKFMRLAGTDATLVLCTALSQQPCLKFEEQGGKSFYRPVDFHKLLAFAGVKVKHTVAPVMAEQFFLYFETEQDARTAERQLSALRLDGRPVLLLQRDGSAIFSGCQLFERIPRDAVMNLESTGTTMPFFEAFYQVEGTKSGMHHPDGLLWIRTPSREHRAHSEKVLLSAVPRRILEMFSIAPPSSMPDDAPAQAPFVAEPPARELTATR